MTAAPDELATDFARFLDRGDVEALGRVFDAASGRLLLLAAHLGGGGGEDLVQATFLAAMRRGRTWDRSRPLLAWLAAILQNEARQRWRRSSRRREVELAAAPAQDAVGADDPAALAASAETVESVLRAIDELPVDYRQVLRLRLVHGLEPIEIARALELSAGAVRVRLHRGRERLRAVLPVGIAGAVLAVLGSGDLLAQVRQHVLQEADAMRPLPFSTSPAAVATTALLMKKTLVGIAIAVIAALAVVLSSSFGEPAPPDVVEPVASPPAPSSATVVPGPVERVPSPAAAPMADESQWALVVEVRNDDDEPLSGADVVVELAPRGPEALVREQIAHGVTDDEGEYRVELEELRGLSVLQRATRLLRVTASKPGYQTSSRYPRKPGYSAAYGDTVHAVRERVRLHHGVTIRGRVVDPHDVPIAAAALHGRSRYGSEQRQQVTWTDGKFEFTATADDPLLTDRDEMQLVIVAPAHGTAVVPMADHELDGNEIDLGTIVLDRGAVVRGVVVLGDGSPLGDFPIDLMAMPPDVPIDGASFSAEQMRARYRRSNAKLSPGAGGDDSYFYRRWAGRTAADGTFVFAGVDPAARYGVAVREGTMREIAIEALPNGEPVRFVVDRQLTTVELFDERGERLPGIGLSLTCWSPGMDRPAEDPLPGFPSTQPWITGGGLESYGQDGSRRILSGFGWVWRFGPRGEAARAEFVRHDVIPGVNRATVRIDVRPEQRFGALRLVVKSESEVPFGDCHVRIQGFERRATRFVSVTEPAVENGHVVSDLPVGTWRLVVGTGRRVLASDGFSRGIFELEIEVYENRTTDVTITVPAGARRGSGSTPKGSRRSSSARSSCATAANGSTSCATTAP